MKPVTVLNIRLPGEVTRLQYRMYCPESTLTAEVDVYCRHAYVEVTAGAHGKTGWVDNIANVLRTRPGDTRHLVVYGPKIRQMAISDALKALQRSGRPGFITTDVNRLLDYIEHVARSGG